HLSEVLEEVRKGRAYVITKRGRPVAELRPPTLPDRRLRFGCDKGRVVLGSDFDAPLDDMKEYSK
ncbi:MAG: type II toxin-antitoxin system prevent-host-death family antitoxin, partial [Acidobacteria bacterium]|nr:type II toxin-antitoxin system prevent-host-death family antitoxin [Acidobacteriota bacterium]